MGGGETSGNLLLSEVAGILLDRDIRQIVKGSRRKRGGKRKGTDHTVRAVVEKGINWRGIVRIFKRD